MAYPLFDRAGAFVWSLSEEEARALYLANMAKPKGKRQTNALTLTVPRRQALGYLRGNRSMASEASRTIIVEHVGPERSRLYQHHERCEGFRGSVSDLIRFA